ncbi:hypothetical protein ACWEPC_52365, partial [Nonomuraea sp. NPDC004297]
APARRAGKPRRLVIRVQSRVPRRGPSYRRPAPVAKHAHAGHRRPDPLHGLGKTIRKAVRVKVLKHLRDHFRN